MFKLVKKNEFSTLNQGLILVWLNVVVVLSQRHEILLETESLSLG